MRLKQILALFHQLCYLFSRQKSTIQEDIVFWKYNYHLPDYNGLCLLLLKYPSFRNVFSYRIKEENKTVLRILITIANLLLKRETNLYITTKEIKGGLFFLHGFSTIVSAKSIGKNCWINQQVTIGYTTPEGAPIIGDNVKIFAGAKVLGDIVVGNNVTIGANAVVVKNVPENCTVVGVPAYIIKRDGIKVCQKL